MPENDQSEITNLLDAAAAGNKGARDRLAELVYTELHRIAHAKMRREPPDHTWQTSDLVHDAMLKLGFSGRFQTMPNRNYLFAAAAKAMYRLLIEHARKRKARGRDLPRSPLDDVLEILEGQKVDVLSLREALEELAGLNARQHEAVMLRYFAELKNEEVAEVLGVSVKTVERDLRMAKAWLYGKIYVE